MDLEWVLSKLRLCDIKVTSTVDQVGIVNIKTENTTYNFNFNDPETAKAFIQNKLTPELENQIKENAENTLTSVFPSLKIVSESTAQEFLAATTAVSTVTVLKKMK